VDRPWTAEFVVDAPLAEHLIRDQFPQLSTVTAEPIASGWDNTVFRVNDGLVFRFPRRQIAVPLVEHELGSLPTLARRLPLPVPQPIFRGRPSAHYPWPFAGYAWLPGHCAAGRVHGMETRVAIARQLGTFLRCLHDMSPGDLPLGAVPSDDLDRLNARKRLPKTLDRLRELHSNAVLADTGPLQIILETAPDPVPPDRLTIVHGDLHMGQILVDDDGAPSGVIDWGDVHAGDAAVDFAIVHQLLPRDRHDAFFSAYGEIAPVRWQLARARAVWHTVAVLSSAIDSHDELLAEEAQLALTLIAS
jgi:aminoglycoside phosphotransferase (APT) family kinase protein